MKNFITYILLFFGLFGYAQVPNDTIYLQPITATKTFNGVLGSAILQIDDAGDDGIITRPLIVAEGFESGLIGVENEFGENNLERFSRSIQLSTSADLQDLLNGGTIIDTGDQDYDIIYVNWDSPRAHLQLNAYVLEEVINWVNEEKEPNADQNVVLGQSMGGVIARYALADMEDDPNLNHDTRLYISHDAPHQGANIPLGIQYFARHLADQFVGTPLGDFSFEVSNDSEASIEEINALLNEPGTQQLLANYITPNFALSTTQFDAFQADLQSKGYPTQTRNIAISNGSHCANTQDYDYNASLFKMNGRARTGVLADLLGSFLGIADDIALAILFDEPALILGVLPGSSQFNLDFNAKALPLANTTANIYKGKVSYTKKLLWFININVTLTDRSENNPVNLSYDKYAGGRYELFDQVNDINFFDDDNDFNGDGEPDITQFHADLLNVLIGSANIDFNTEQTFGFIPVPSALDVGGGATTLNDSDYFKNYNAATPPTGSRSIPFDNFITAYFNNNSENEEHISFNFRNGDWLALELDAMAGNEDIFDCSYICEGERISGIDTVCSSATYSVPNGATFYNWSITGGHSFATLTGSGNTVTLSRNGVSSGYVTIEVVYGDNFAACGDVVLTKRVWVGTPQIADMVEFYNTSTGAVGYLCSFYTGNKFKFTMNGANHVKKFQYRMKLWNSSTYAYQSKIKSAVSSTIVETAPSSLSPGVYHFEIRLENSCGWSQWFPYFVQYMDCSNSGMFRAYPNPTSNTLTVANKGGEQLNKNSSFEPSNGVYGTMATSRNNNTFNFYDFIGNRVLFGQLDDITNIDVSQLKKGTYILEINANGQKETHQIVIE